MSLREDMDALAKAVREKATEKNTPLQESIDALKALTAYYSAVQKNKGDDPGDPEKPTFDDFSQQINEGHQPDATVPGRRRITGAAAPRHS